MLRFIFKTISVFFSCLKIEAKQKRQSRIENTVCDIATKVAGGLVEVAVATGKVATKKHFKSENKQKQLSESDVLKPKIQLASEHSSSISSSPSMVSASKSEKSEVTSARTSTSSGAENSASSHADHTTQDNTKPVSRSPIPTKSNPIFPTGGNLFGLPHSSMHTLQNNFQSSRLKLDPFTQSLFKKT